ncbi:MAG TPA: VWA domain-containing protein, partial [Steroidobacteraceae bacterium]
DLESPKRIDRLKVAASDFVATAENGTEVGIVSFASDAETGSGRVSVPIAALGANRSAWSDEIDDMAPDSMTNIGAGLQKAKDMIVAAGGVTANTYVVLMTDGVNNEPGGGATAQADLDAKIADLLASGIPVFVTCTGGDLGLQSQCAEIASGTNGTYSDSADAARLPQNFVDFHERITGHQGVGTIDSKLKSIAGGHGVKFLVDQYSESASFSLLWDNKASSANAVLVDPSGTRHQTRAIPQGRYARIRNPLAGEWTMIINTDGPDSRAIARAYVQNRISNFVTSTRNPTQEPGEEIYVYASARSMGGGLSEPGTKLVANVTLPGGGTDTLELFDNGRDPGGHGDDMAGDGIYTGVYTNTSQKGAYGFSVTGAIDKWHQGSDPHKQNPTIMSPRFDRDVRVSAAVGSPGDVVTNPEDERPKPGKVDVNRWILILILILLILLIIMQWLCCRKRNPDPVVIR